MLTRWGSLWDDFDSAFTRMDLLRREMDRLFEGHDAGSFRQLSTATPRANLFDAGSQLVVQSEVPGLSEKEVMVTLNDGILTIQGERKADIPEGWTVHRQERSAWRFSRSFSLPCAVDPEKATASVKDGVLTVTIAKAPEAQPRQIAVKAH